MITRNGTVRSLRAEKQKGQYMQYETIDFEIRGSGAWIMLNRPKEMNAITERMLDELDAALTECKANNNVLAVVLTGRGSAFCAGADLKGVLSSLEKAPPGAKDFLDRYYDVFRYLRNFPKPIIAALNGITLAGGLEIAMCCDIIFAAEGAEIGDAHSNFGVFPGGGGAAVLPKKVGHNRAKYLLFSGDFLPATELEKYGLVNKVVPDADLVGEVEKLIEKLATKSPLVLRRMKEVANASFDQTQDEALRYEMLNLRQHCRSYDLQEGLKAFAEKRKPEFKGY